MVTTLGGHPVIWKKIVALLIIGCSLLAPVLVFGSTNNVIHIRISPSADELRIVFDLSSPVHYRLTQGKEQLLLTITDTHLRFPLPSLPVNNLVKKYQSQAHESDLQFQFAINQKLNTRLYFLAPGEGYGDRLVLELKPAVILTEEKMPALKPVENHVDTVAIPEKKSVPKSLAAVSDKPVMTAANKSPSHGRMIIIDPGHGGKDPGAVGPAGYQEKNIVLAIAKKLQETLRQEGYQAVLTRDRDFFIPLRQRLAIARRYKPDLFVAVHADAAYSGSTANGASVFALSERGATSEGARWLAVKENQSELIDGVFVDKDPMLRSVLLDLSQTHTIGVSLEMGREILQQLSKMTHLHYAGVEQAAFVVLKSPDIPSLLIETGYITNPKQEQQLSNPVYQKQLALNIVQGIKSYFASHPQ